MQNARRIHVLLGTKAQLIKMGPIMRALSDAGIEYNFILTGQHHETLTELMDNFGICEPDACLVESTDVVGVVQMLVWMVKAFWNGVRRKKEIFGKSPRGDFILVHGDTISTLIGSVLGRLHGMQVCHVESGLRSFNLLHPFPEEITRILVFRLTHIYFCPGEWALGNLENYKGVKVDTKANSLYDARMLSLKSETNLDHVPQERYVVCTLHRYENIFNQSRLLWMVEQVEAIAEKFKVLFVLHPPTEKCLRKNGLLERLADNEKVDLRSRYDYFRFMRLLERAEFVVSDGGSNQEECYYLGVPCLLFRDRSERIEGIGENVFVSEYKKSRVKDFVSNYHSYRREVVKLKQSPTEIIVRHLQQKI